ncbi:factor interacting with poly(A) polymerase 1 isoform X2 [Lycorma delicatula]|uniref:factor interacting with poly(A) polymerase 1 isoform X2 n=1 Tax=Lycorma delicatula TaxID=130591 RepID=UPI003F51A2EE
MADDDVNEDQWLYGDSNPDKSEDAAADDALYGDKFDTSQDSNATNQLPPVLEPPIIEPPQKNFNTTDSSNHDKLLNSTSEHEKLLGDLNKEQKTQEDGEEEEEEDDEEEDGEVDDSNKNDTTMNSGAPCAEDEEEDDDDDSEDDVNVVIGEIKTSSQYTIKRGGLLNAGPQLKQPGKFSIEEFETIGTINGIPTHDFSLDSLEDKPWRKPGADITDYFNYGFNEETWRAYCERQKRMRVQESGVGLGQLSGIAPQVVNQATAVRGNIPVTIVNDNSKYAAAPGSIAPAVVGQRKAGPPPGRRVAGTIDVLGNSNLNPNRGESPPKGNVIQVMTADRREYSRKAGFPDMSLPPPGIPPPGFDGGPFGADYSGEYYNSEMDPYYQAYEPTQDSQWANSDAADKSNSTLPGGITIKQERDTSKERERERDRDRDRDRERDRDRSERERERSERHRERSHRHRSRSRSTERRSRKHKSRSRSPGHRSHKKKKSKKSDRAKEESD